MSEAQNHEEKKPEEQKGGKDTEKLSKQVEKKVEEEPSSKESERTEEAKEETNDTSVADDSAIVDSSVNVTKSEDAEAGDDEASDGSDSDESLPPGLLERPVEILESKRERKKITRFTYDDEKPSPSSDRKTVEIPKGNGIPLKSHPRVEYQLTRNTVEDLKIIHKFFYGIPGNNYAVKRNIREFCGFVMDKDSPQYEKKEDLIGKFTVDNLKWAMKVCDVPSVKGKKEDLIDAFMEWCLCPKPQDIPVTKSIKKEKGEKKKRKKAKRNSKQMENGNSTSDTTPAKKSKLNPLKRKKKIEKKKPGERKARIKISSPKPKSKSELNLIGSSSDDEPLDTLRKSPPSNIEIRKYVESLLKDADLEVMTMKVVFQQVYEHYPEFDLTDRRSFIKETVKKIIS